MEVVVDIIWRVLMFVAERYGHIVLNFVMDAGSLSIMLLSLSMEV